VQRVYDFSVLEPGRYLIAYEWHTAVPFSFTMPSGWVSENFGRTVSKHPDQPHEMGWNPFVIDKIFSDACSADDESEVEVGPSVDDLVNAVLSQPGPATSGPVEITMDGYPGKRVDLTVRTGLDPSTCRIEVGLQLWKDRGGKHQVLLPDGTISVYIVDVDGERLVIATQYREGSSEEDIAEMEAIIASIEIED
jgi:hypothetical protein